MPSEAAVPGGAGTCSACRSEGRGQQIYQCAWVLCSIGIGGTLQNTVSPREELDIRGFRVASSLVFLDSFLHVGILCVKESRILGLRTNSRAACVLDDRGIPIKA